MAGIGLTPANLAAITTAVAAGFPAPPPAPPPLPPRDFVAEQNLKDRRAVLQKQLFRYDGERRVKTLRRWLEVQETYLKTFVPVTINPAPPPTYLPGVWPAGLNRELMMEHLKTQVEKGAQTMHDILEAEINAVTGLPTITNWTQYVTRFVAEFLPTTVRNEVVQNLQAMRFTGSMNKLVEDMREQIEEITAANVLSNGVQAMVSNLDLALIFQNMFEKSNHPKAASIHDEIARFRTANPNSPISSIMEHISAYWASLGNTDDSTSRPRNTRREESVALAPRGMLMRGRGRIGRGRLPLYQPYQEMVTCHYCGNIGHRANQCASNPDAGFAASRGFGFGAFRGRGSYRGPSSSAATRGAAAGRGRGGTPGTQGTGQGTNQGQGPAGRGQGARPFPFGPRYRQPYRAFPAYGASPYEVQYYGYEDEGYYQDSYDDYGYLNFDVNQYDVDTEAEADAMALDGPTEERTAPDPALSDFQ